MRIAILGSTGMLGSMVLRYLSQQSEYDLSTIDRPGFDAEAPFLAPILSDFLRGHDYAINCIGIIKPRIDEHSAASVERAIRVNALFPYALACAAELTGCKVIQIATDCVYSGEEGNYIESSLHDATDVYGKTKSLGEVVFLNVYHLRCSIVGPEPAGRLKESLLEWFLRQPEGATVSGYTNHLWNGITTLAFARICHGIMLRGINLPSVQHVVPFCPIDKAELLYRFAEFYGREDIRIEMTKAPVAVNRTLGTTNEAMNMRLWQAAGYSYPPAVAEMIAGMAWMKEEVSAR